MTCLLCGEPDPDVLVNGGTAGYHRECFLYGIIGHAVRVCTCYGYPKDGGVRKAAQLAMKRWEDHEQEQETQ